MKAFMKQAIAVSALALTANSWGYPIHTNSIDNFFSSEKARKFIALETEKVVGQSRRADIFSLTNTFSHEPNAKFDNYSFVLAALQDSENARLFEQTKLWKPNKDNLVLWVGFDLYERIRSAESANGKTQSVNPNTESSVNQNPQVSVPEPGSVALICSGIFGLMMARRLGKRSNA